jgi:hypothetical protein
MLRHDLAAAGRRLAEPGGSHFAHTVIEVVDHRQPSTEARLNIM